MLYHYLWKIFSIINYIYFHYSNILYEDINILITNTNEKPEKVIEMLKKNPINGSSTEILANYFV